MLSSLSVLPKVVKESLVVLVNRGDFVRVYDMATFDGGYMGGVLYVVMRAGTRLWLPEFRDIESGVMDVLTQLNENAWDMTDGIHCTTENAPMWLDDVEEYVEGVDYRVLLRDDVLKEVSI